MLKNVKSGKLLYHMPSLVGTNPDCARGRITICMLNTKALDVIIVLGGVIYLVIKQPLGRSMKAVFV